MENVQPGLRHGDSVVVGGRRGVYMYAQGGAAVVRYLGERSARVVPLQRVAASPADADDAAEVARSQRS